MALAVPFVVGPVLGLTGARRTSLRMTLGTRGERSSEGDDVQVELTLTAPVDLDAVAVRVPAAGLEPAGHAGAVVTAVRADEPLTLVLPYRAERWGRHEVGAAVARCHSLALLRAGAVTAAPVQVTVLPHVEALSTRAAVPQARAYAGAHRSRAVGEGVEFAGVRPFVTGDRLRRVNWRATARSSGLQVTTTRTDRSADVVIVLDALHDVGPPGTSSVDTEVRAAAGIAEHYLGIGDSVGLFEYGGHQRMLAPGSGRAQLARVRDWLVGTRSVVTAAVRSVRWPELFAARAPLTVVLTPLVDDASMTLLADLRLRGAAVVAIDTLPAEAPPPARTDAGRVALRLWNLERRMLVSRLGDIGVPVAAWTGAESLDLLLRDLARVAAAPRAALR